MSFVSLGISSSASNRSCAGNDIIAFVLKTLVKPIQPLVSVSVVSTSIKK